MDPADGSWDHISDWRSQNAARGRTLVGWKLCCLRSLRQHEKRCSGGTWGWWRDFDGLDYVV